MIYIDENSALNLYHYDELTEKLLKAHLVPTQIIDDLLLESEHNSLKNHLFIRSAWQEEHYLGSKIITIFPENRNLQGLPSIQALYTLFDGKNGAPLCCIDGTALTAIKTAADSALAMDLLARKNSRTLLMIGAGSMASHLIEAHTALRPSLKEIMIWNRTASHCESVINQLNCKGIHIRQVTDLDSAVSQADLICSATTATTPLIKGELLQPGCHLDLVGSFTAQHREADNEAVKRSSIFVDARKTTIGVVGEIIQPVSQGIISAADIKADFYDAVKSNAFTRIDDDEITLFKNGGGGHLDLMMAQILYEKYITK